MPCPPVSAAVRTSVAARCRATIVHWLVPFGLLCVASLATAAITDHSRLVSRLAAWVPAQWVEDDRQAPSPHAAPWAAPAAQPRARAETGVFARLHQWLLPNHRSSAAASPAAASFAHGAAHGPLPPSRTPGTSRVELPNLVSLRTDLSYVDKSSPAYVRFKAWVDAAVAGNAGYNFSASEAVLMYLLSREQKYCDLAVLMTESQVADAESQIASGSQPEVAGDSYLYVGHMIPDLAMTYNSCAISASQRQRWSAYAEQTIWNVWNYDNARWGNRAFPWSGWSTSNPGNNYYYSFMEATMSWALASNSQTWMNLLRQNKLPALQAYFANLPGGGSREGTGYGTSHMRLFWLYLLWHDATGVDLANANTHLNDSILYWTHATLPTLDRYAPIGDQARNSIPDLYDYHRRLMLEARQASNDPRARDIASWWLNNISVSRMTSGFNNRYDLLPAGSGGTPPSELLYHAKGTGHLFARTGWDRNAMWLSFVAGPYDESHAHQDQGSFTLFAGDWLAVTENIWSHSGIQQGTEVHNVVRFERSNPSASQCVSPSGDAIVHQCEQTVSTLEVTPGANDTFSALADLTPAYRGNPALQSWKRRIDFGARRLTVRDTFQLGAGTRAFFQLNVPSQPQISGRQATAGRLRIRVLEPANAVLSARDWRTVDSGEYTSGWRLDVSGGNTGYVVELSEN